MQLKASMLVRGAECKSDGSLYDIPNYGAYTAPEFKGFWFKENPWMYAAIVSGIGYAAWMRYLLK